MQLGAKCGQPLFASVVSGALPEIVASWGPWCDRLLKTGVTEQMGPSVKNRRHRADGTVC